MARPGFGVSGDGVDSDDGAEVMAFARTLRPRVEFEAES